MKKCRVILVILVMACIATNAKAQLFKEWFQQKKTQKQYLLKQIAELQLYIGYLKSGYDIVESGVSTIRDIKSGEFSLHDVYYTSLKSVNPKIRQHPQARTVLSNQQYILDLTTSLQQACKESNQLPLTQKDLIEGVCEELAADVERNTDEMIKVLSNNELEMTDDQRMQRIQFLHDYSLRQLVFIKGLSADFFLVTRQRGQDERDQQRIKQLYDLK